MSGKELDELLARMPQIAQAVERFKSESIQSEALRALIRAYGLAGEASEDGAQTGTGESLAQDSKNGSGTAPPAPAKKSAPKTAPAPKVKQSFSIDKTLDLVKGGSPSFKEFW